MHDSCYIKLCNPSKLAQVEKRKENQSQNIVSPDESSFNSSTTVRDESFSSPPPKHTRNAGIVRDKTNVFGVSRDQIKSTKSHLISSLRAWSSFKHHTILLKDDEIRTCITTLIDFIDSDTDPFAIEEISSQLLARTCVSSSSFRRRSHTCAKCLLN